MEEYESKELELAMRRVRWLARFAFLWALLIVVRLVQLQIVRHAEFHRLATNQQEHLEKVQPPRGAILDRNGERLAMSLPVDSVFLNPLQIPDPALASEILAKILDLDQHKLLADIREAVENHRGFIWVKRRIDPEESERLRGLKLDWIGFDSESRRFYPYKSLAAHVVGSVDTDEKGLEGVERRLNGDLTGRVGLVRVSADVQQHDFDSELASAPAEPGRDIHLTIDSRIQYVAERELKASMIKHHCYTGSLVAMNPNTGEILALASYPSFDPNEPVHKGDDRTVRFNNAVSVPFEPGSVFKVVTLTAALETTKLKPETVINCGGGVLHIFGRTIHDHEAYSSLSMADVLAHSSNIGAIHIGLTVGRDNMYDYVRRFGFGVKPGLPLPGESPGLVWPAKRWQPSSLASVSMGHEVMVTTVQLARACSVIANGGYLVKPTLVAAAPQVAPRRVIRPETAITMRRLMEGVVLYGTGRFARLAGYSAAGKTGTAQIVDLKTHHYTHFYNSSFMGFAPVVNPAIVVVVTGNGSSGNAGFGAEVAAPVFKAVTEAALRYLDVPKDLPDVVPSPDNKVDTNDLAIADLGSDRLPLDPPDEGDQRETLLPASEVPSNFVSGPKAPNFVGMTMKEVVEESSADGIDVEFLGHGIAREQVPPAGTMLPAGERVKVQFAR